MGTNEEKPTLAKLLQVAVDSRLCDLHTSMPGIVVSYDRATQTAKVQPALKRKYVNGETVELPIINKVPVIFPRAKGKWVHFDLEADDVVTLLFSERSLDNWKEKGGVVSPDDPRKFNLSDAYAIPGGYDSGSALVPNGKPGSIEMALDDKYFVIEADGEMKLTNGSGTIEITPDGKFKMENDAEELLAVLVLFITELSGFQDTAGFGWNPLAITKLDEIKASLESLKG